LFVWLYIHILRDLAADDGVRRMVELGARLEFGPGKGLHRPIIGHPSQWLRRRAFPSAPRC
jgi:hypothetical protein